MEQTERKLLAFELGVAKGRQSQRKPRISGKVCPGLGNYLKEEKGKVSFFWVIQTVDWLNSAPLVSLN